MINFTAYQLACGHVFTDKQGENKVEIHREHSTYHVRRFSRFIDGRLVQDAWLCFDNLKDARKAFKRQSEIMRGEKL